MEAQKVTLAQREMQNVAEYFYLMTYDVIKYRKLSYNRILSDVWDKSVNIVCISVESASKYNFKR
jgi:hypothetical protein